MSLTGIACPGITRGELKDIRSEYRGSINEFVVINENIKTHDTDIYSYPQLNPQIRLHVRQNVSVFPRILLHYHQVSCLSDKLDVQPKYLGCYIYFPVVIFFVCLCYFCVQ